jgi:hypothetical protein
MSFIGKLLVGAQLAFSIIFLGFAGAVFTAQQNWKKQSEDLTKQVADLKSEKANSDVEHKNYVDRMERDLKEEKKNAATAEGRVTTLEKQLDAAEDLLGKAKTQSDEQRTLAKVATEEARQRREEALVQRAVNNDLQKLLNEKNDRVRALEDIVFNKGVEEKALQEKHSKVLGDVVLYQKIIAANGLSTDPKSVTGLQEPPPDVDGEVKETKRGGRNGSDLVEISIGSDDGLAEGHKLSVFRPANGERQAKFLGEIRIVFVTPDRAVGTVVTRAKNGIIERGDIVTSKL